MDVYTSAFSYPRRSRSLHSPSSSLDLPNNESVTSFLLRNLQVQQSHHFALCIRTISEPTPSDHESIQKLAMMVMGMHGCHVTYYLGEQGRGWNFHVTGAYQQVSLTRGLILKECPIKVRFSQPCRCTVPRGRTRRLTILPFLAPCIHQSCALRDTRFAHQQSFNQGSSSSQIG